MREEEGVGFCSLHYIIWRLYDVVGGGKCEFDAVTRADILSRFHRLFCGQSDEGYAMCRHNEWLCRLVFTGRRGRRPLQ